VRPVRDAATFAAAYTSLLTRVGVAAVEPIAASVCSSVLHTVPQRC
jgi:hypothetical protein